MALVPPPATAIMLKKKGIYGHPTLLIWAIISLKRQEPTRLSQSQSPSLFCADINIRYTAAFSALLLICRVFLFLLRQL
jgi:hypothetical protein